MMGEHCGKGKQQLAALEEHLQTTLLPLDNHIGSDYAADQSY